MNVVRGLLASLGELLVIAAGAVALLAAASIVL